MVVFESGVFIEIEGDDVPERQALLAVQIDQLLIDRQRFFSGYQAEDRSVSEGGPVADQRGDFGRDPGAGGIAN